jgi:hypothetical protein
MLSKFGNYYASWVLGLRLTDMTSGFRCYARRPLEAIGLDEIHSNGYSFQIEMAYRISVAGFKVGEIPIIFYERATGVSKMSKKIFREAVVLPWMLRLARTLGGLKGAKADLKYHARTVIGFLCLIIGLAGSLRLGWWLGTEGDIIEVIHRAKMALPGWAWTMMKIGLSAFSGVAFIVSIMTLATAIFAGGRRK